jgi:hypothetical protein
VEPPIGQIGRKRGLVEPPIGQIGRQRGLVEPPIGQIGRRRGPVRPQKAYASRPSVALFADEERLNCAAGFRTDHLLAERLRMSRPNYERSAPTCVLIRRIAPNLSEDAALGLTAANAVPLCDRKASVGWQAPVTASTWTTLVRPLCGRTLPRLRPTRPPPLSTQSSRKTQSDLLVTRRSQQFVTSRALISVDGISVYVIRGLCVCVGLHAVHRTGFKIAVQVRTRVKIRRLERLRRATGWVL